MAELDSRLDDIARQACSKDLPHGYLTETENSLLADHLSAPVPKHVIAQAMGSFSAMTNLLMPGDTVHQYVDERCKWYPMPSPVREKSSMLLVPGWSEPGDPLTVLDAEGNLDREQSAGKFTRDEVMDTLKMAYECPDLPLSFLYLQSLLEGYFLELRERIGKIDETRAASIAQFQHHWTSAANLMRFFMMTISDQLPKDRGEEAFDFVTQDIVTEAFDRLDAYKAFEFSTPELQSVGMEARKFVCPARQLLRELMVTNGTYMKVVKRMHAFRQSMFLHQVERIQYELSLGVVQNMAQATRHVINAGGAAAFALLNKSFAEPFRRERGLSATPEEGDWPKPS